MNRISLPMPSSRRANPAPAPRARVRRGNQEDAERLRQDLLRAAAELAAEQGARAVSIRAVATRVGVSPMTTYRYFADKSELLSGIWDRQLQALLDRWEAALAPVEGALARHRVYVETFLRYWQAHPDDYCLLYGFNEVGKVHVERGWVNDAPTAVAVRALADRMTSDVAAEIGTGLQHAKVASDTRYAMLLGFLYGTLVVRTYAWSDLDGLRAQYCELVGLTVVQCLRGEGRQDSAPTPRAPS